MSFPAPTWTNQLAEAAKLSDSELKRHASVSTNNKHECRDCFCCACVEELKRRKRANNIRNRLDD